MDKKCLRSESVPLTLAKESTAYKFCSLKHSGRIHSCFTRNDVIHLETNEKSKPFKIDHLSKFKELFEYSDTDDDAVVEIAVGHWTLAC